MNNLLIGNGINIQFDKINYTPKAIVIRLIEELDSPDFPKHIIIDEPVLMKYYIGELFLFARKAIDGYLTDSAVIKAEKIALAEFICRYKDKKKSLRIADIGFEDYYLIHDLVCHKHRIVNPEQYTTREAMRMSYLHSIYNHGEIELLYENYSSSLLQFLREFDCIFTTNYDSNIESAIGKEVWHIHGQFNKLSEVYNPNSFRNSLHDNPLEGIVLDSEFNYLHSTALSTYCGDYKQYQMKQHQLANSAIEKFAEAFLRDDKVKTSIDSWEKDSNRLVSNLADAIKVKINNPDLRFQEDYHINKLGEISGELTILGLSPYNDYHLFEIIDCANVKRCTYYYFSIEESEKIKEILPKLNGINKLYFEDVKEFWRRIK